MSFLPCYFKQITQNINIIGGGIFIYIHVFHLFSIILFHFDSPKQVNSKLTILNPLPGLLYDVLLEGSLFLHSLIYIVRNHLYELNMFNAVDSTKYFTSLDRIEKYIGCKGLRKRRHQIEMVKKRKVALLQN